MTVVLDLLNNPRPAPDKPATSVYSPTHDVEITAIIDLAGRGKVLDVQSALVRGATIKVIGIDGRERLFLAGQRVVELQRHGNLCVGHPLPIPALNAERAMPKACLRHDV